MLTREVGAKEAVGRNWQYQEKGGSLVPEQAKAEGGTEKPVPEDRRRNQTRYWKDRRKNNTNEGKERITTNAGIDRVTLEGGGNGETKGTTRESKHSLQGTRPVKAQRRTA